MTDFSQRVTPGVQGLKPYEPGKPLSELEREYGITQAIKLASNENPLGPSPRAVAAAQVALSEVHRYPDGNGFALKQALAQKFNWLPTQISLGNGSNDVLEFIARAFLGPGCNAVFSQYAFAVYAIVTQAAGAASKIVPALPKNASQPYGHDGQALAATIDEHTRVVFIANPNNPTGTWMSVTELEHLLKRIPADVIVVIDEAYAEYIQTPDYPDTSRWLTTYPNLIVAHTFSKAYGLAGLRVGYAVASPEITHLINRVRQPFNVNSVALAAAEAALNDNVHLSRSIDVNRAGLKQLGDGLNSLGLFFIPSQGNFLCFQVTPPPRVVYEQLLRLGVIIRPVDNYGLKEFLRVSVGTQAENKRFLTSLAEVLQS